MVYLHTIYELCFGEAYFESCDFSTGTCFIQKIYAPSSSLLRKRRGGGGIYFLNETSGACGFFPRKYKYRCIRVYVRFKDDNHVI